MPSEVEPFGLAYIEAAVAGVPSIATSVGGAGTIVAEGTGLLVPPGDEEALLGAMRTLADPAVARRMGAAARERSRLFTWELRRGAAAARAGAAGRRGRGVPVSWAVCVLNWNGREDTLRCLASLRRRARVIVADNGSSDGSVEAIRAAFPDVEVVENGANLGFSGGNNAAIRRALDGGAEWVVLLNNDAEAEPGLLDALQAAAARHPDAGVLAGKLLFPDGRVQWAGQRVGLRTGYSGRPRGHGREDGFAFSVEGRTRARGRRADGGLARRDRARGAARRGPVRLRRGRRLVAADPRRGLRVRVRPGRARRAPAVGLDRRRELDRDRCTTAPATRSWCASGMLPLGPAGTALRRASVRRRRSSRTPRSCCGRARRWRRCWRATRDARAGRLGPRRTAAG